MIEVKARGTDIFMEPHEAVTKKKVKSIVSATDEYLKSLKIDKEVRFDIISVLPDETGKLKISVLSRKILTILPIMSVPLLPLSVKQMTPYMV